MSHFERDAKILREAANYMNNHMRFETSEEGVTWMMRQEADRLDALHKMQLVEEKLGSDILEYIWREQPKTLPPDGYQAAYRAIGRFALDAAKKAL